MLARFGHRRSALQRMAAPVLAAEAGDSVAVSPRGELPPAGRLCVQPAGTAAAALPSHIHQALHCSPGTAGSDRYSCPPAMGTTAGSNTEPVDGGGGLRGGTITLVQGSCEHALSAAA